MANISQMINPVTGKPYGDRFATAPGNPGQNFGMGALASGNQTQQTMQPQTLTNSRDMRNEQQTIGADFSPYLNKLQGLLNDPSSIQNDPSYQFRLGQGNQAINRSAAAKGMLGSGNVLAELAKYGQGMASEEYGNQFNRLSDLMQNSQRFGVATDYWKQPTYGASRTTSALNFV